MRVRANKCVEEYLKTRVPGLYQALSLVIRAYYGVRADEIVMNDLRLITLALKRLYGEEATQFIIKMLEEACFKEAT